MPGHYADNFIAYIIPLNSSVFHEVEITTPVLQIGKQVQSGEVSNPSSHYH